MKRLYCILLLFVVGCQQTTTSTPIVITEIVEFADGERVVITIEATPIAEIVAATPEPTIAVQPRTVALDVGYVDQAISLDPQRADSQLSLDLVENLYIGLTRYDNANARLLPALAQSWSTADGGRTWRFDLRDDVAWAKVRPPRQSTLFSSERGEDQPLPLAEVMRVAPLTADDLVFAIQRGCDSGSRAQAAFVLFIIEGCRQQYELNNPTAEQLASIAVRALDPTTVEIRLTQPAAYFPTLTALPIFRPLPRDRIEDPEIDWLDAEQFVASGPFIYSGQSAQEEAGTVIGLQANPLWPAPLYVDEQQLVDEFLPVQRLNFHLFENSALAYEAYVADLLDIVTAPVAMLDELRNSSVAPPPLIANTDLFYLAFNFDSPTFGAAEVRRAFSAAIDREKLIDDLYNGRAAAMRHFLPAAVMHAPAQNAGVGFSPDYARSQLFASGFEGCRRIGPIRYAVSATDIALQQAEILISMWVENLGCDEKQFEVEQMQLGELLAATNRDVESRPDIWDLAWSAFYPDAHGWYNPILHCVNGENRQNRPCSEVDNMIRQAGIAIDLDTRAALYRQITSTFFSDVGIMPLAPLYVRGEFRLVQDWIDYLPEFAVSARFAGEAYDRWIVNQTLKDLERSQ